MKMKWLRKLLGAKTIKHWWRENHDGSYRIVACVTKNNVSEDHLIGVITFNPDLPKDAQQAAIKLVCNGLSGV